MNIAKFLRTAFFIEHLLWLLLYGINVIADMFHVKVSFDLMYNKVSWRNMFLIKIRLFSLMLQVILRFKLPSQKYLSLSSVYDTKLVFSSFANVFFLKSVFIDVLEYPKEKLLTINNLLTFLKERNCIYLLYWCNFCRK